MIVVKKTYVSALPGREKEPHGLVLKVRTPQPSVQFGSLTVPAREAEQYLTFFSPTPWEGFEDGIEVPKELLAHLKG